MMLRLRRKWLGRGSWCVFNVAKPRGLIFTNDRKVLLFSISEAKVVHTQRGQSLVDTSSRMIEKYYGLGEANVVHS